MLPKKTIVLISAILMGFMLELFLAHYAWYPWLLLGWLFALGISVWLTIVDRLFSKPFFLYLITPVIFSISVYLFLSLMESDLVKQIIVFGASALYWLYLENVAVFNFDYQNYHHPALENVSNYTNIIAIFFLSITAYATQALLAIPVWQLAVALIFTIFLLLIQSIWAAQFNEPKSGLYLITMIIVMLELFWTVSFLPSNFFLQGFFITIGYYLVWGIMKTNLLGVLSRKILIRYLSLCGVALLAVILTARWL